MNDPSRVQIYFFALSIILVMPAYDISLWDYLKYTSQLKKDRNDNDLFPMKERLEMSQRICDGLFQMNTVYNTAHRDIKLRLVLKSTITNRIFRFPVIFSPSIDRFQKFP